MPKYEDGHVYHVYNRGAHKARIFTDASDYSRLLRLMEKYAKKYTVTVVAYCLMPNHYHLLLRQEAQGSISEFLKITFNAFVQAINVLRHHSGTLFQGSAKGIPVDSDDYTLQLIRYIHLNPVEAKLAKRAENWEFSDYRDWVGVRKGPLFDPSFRQGLFKTSEDYRRFVESYEGESEVGKFMLD